MFLFGLGSKKIQGKLEEDPKVGENLIRSCSRCGSFFELVYDLEDELDSSEIGKTFESVHDMFLDYLSLEKRNPDNFEDFILQFIEVSIERDNRTLSNKTNAEESLCVDCMNCLISQFSMALNKEISIMDKYKDISDLFVSSECHDEDKNIINNRSEDELANSEDNFEASSKEYLEIMNIYNEFLKMTQFSQDNKIMNNENQISEIDCDKADQDIKEGDNECRFHAINIIEMDDLAELRQNQNLELNLKQELIQYETKREGMKNHLNFLRGYLERLKRSDFLNLSFYIQVKDGVTCINGLSPALFEADFENWNEVNAALGTSALLLYTILDRHKLPLSINPSGSYSTIKDSNSSIWPLHGSTLCNSDYNECTNFDKGISLFVFLIDTVYNTIPGTKESLPYLVDQRNGTIGGIRPNLLFNERELWNRAMSMNLINLKWLLVRSSESIKDKLSGTR
ncbi:beclin1 [Cryptosporidium sp. chipmunk genotype I]|uniref:beclin1 n=1 Tax=Cryptosporidium sp. chipmunk genotype I TaxID=1280935 RepID=UPI00351A53FD|nr:beclin1 [Cryptosporidium sp. chipmunk genotype I]